MEEEYRKNWLSRLFFFLFDKQIREKKKSWFKSFQEIVSLVGAAVLTIIGFSFSSKIVLGIIIAVIVAGLDIVLYLGIQRIIDYIDFKTQESAKDKENELARYQAGEKDLKARIETLTYQNEYYCDLSSNTAVLTDEISKANKTRTTKALYGLLGSSIVDMTTSYSGIPKKNFSVHIYGYDDSTKMIRRLIVRSYVESKQKASETDAVSIEEPNVKKKYYAQVMLDPTKKISKFSSNEEIISELNFDDEPEEIKKMFTQYAGMVYNVGHGIKLYVEVVSYNGVSLAPAGKDLGLFIEKVIAPFSSPMSNVNWEAIGGDLHA